MSLILASLSELDEIFGSLSSTKFDLKLSKIQVKEKRVVSIRLIDLLSKFGNGN